MLKDTKPLSLNNCKSLLIRRNNLRVSTRFVRRFQYGQF
ncbi:hypothetical protein [uncultured Gammaproteobacteria bacterium]|nr:hypothetical protein [uncultured Gammaproteobacteria bacterium]CAC9571578.1 hypothetical protein [uncultured Gammaproteobacteria bacterium]